MERSATDWIERLDLQPHPEGGFFRETYRAAEMVAAAHLPARFDGARPFATAILFLLPAGEVSVLHRIRSDEIWHFHAGGPLDIIVLDGDGAVRETRLGASAERGEVFQAVVPAGRWFGARPAPGSAYSLVGCTVAPGFDFADFELAPREALLARYPQHAVLIRALTR